VEVDDLKLVCCAALGEDGWQALDVLDPALVIANQHVDLAIGDLGLLRGQLLRDLAAADASAQNPLAVAPEPNLGKDVFRFGHSLPQYPMGRDSRGRLTQAKQA